MNGTHDMDDDQTLTAVRQSLAGVRDSLDEVRMHRPVESLFGQARVRKLRRALAIRAAVACGLSAATAAGVLTAAGISAHDAATARENAYVTRRVERALATEHLVFVGRSDGKDGKDITYAYGSQTQWQEYWPTADYKDRLVGGQRLWDFPPADRGQIYSTEGTALIGGALVDAYVTYQDRKYSLSRLAQPETSACSTNAALSMGSYVVPDAKWSAFIKSTLACGAASVTGHVRINGVETTRISGKAVTVRLSKGYSKVIGAKWAQSRWVIYVSPKTFLPVRISGWTKTYGGPAATYVSSGVTNVQWLRPTTANIARTLVTIPPGFKRVYSVANQ